MKQLYILNEKYNGIDFEINRLKIGIYEQCSFINCNFANSDLSEVVFTDCIFISCNLTLVQITKTAFRNIKFTECKMLGISFDNCNEFGLAFSFDNCNLNHASFFKTKIKKTVFKGSTLHEVDFTGCDLTGSLFDHCDHTRATFENSILEKVDFRTSFNYSFDPDVNRIRKAKFSLYGLPGLLNKYDIDIDDLM